MIARHFRNGLPALFPPIRMGTGAVPAGIISLLLAAVLTTGALAGTGGEEFCLEFRSYPDEKVLRRIPVARGERFSTLITHSIHLSPVYETYRVEGEGAIRLESTRLKDMGWGVPSTFDNTRRLRDGFLIIEGFDKILPDLPFRVSAVNDAKLLVGDLPEDPDAFDGITVRLGDYVPDGKRITFRIARAGGSTRKH